jgi:hypothetical protein
MREMRPKALFVVTAVVELATGLALLGLPAVVLASLLGIQPATADTLIVARIAGAALLAIGVACALARDDGGLPPDPPVPTADAPERPGAERISVWFHIGIAASDRTRADAGAGTGPTATRRTDRAGRVAPDAGARFPNRCWGVHFMQNEGRALAAPRLATQVDAIWLHSTGR